MRIAFIGVGYFPGRMASEKNFYLKLLPLIKDKVDDVIVLSINDQTEKMFSQITSNGSIPIYNFKRPFHKGGDDRFLKVVNKLYCYHHRHSPAQEMFEKFLVLFVNIGRIRDILEKHKIDLIYFMDNFGFGMGYLKRKLTKKTMFAAANYDPRGHFYDQIQFNFIRNLDLIVTYSQAYKKILHDLGIKKNQIEVIHWGIDPKTLKPLDDDTKKKIRKRYGIHRNKFFVLWTGYIQQIQEKDFYLTISIAKTIINSRSDIQFIFCFKPETYKTVYKNENCDDIEIIAGASESSFHELLGSADLLLSPSYKISSTVSPPLTWIEAMSMEVPVLTTEIKGADEIILNGETGYISKNYETIIQDIQTIIDSGINQNMKSNAKKMIEENYNIHLIADGYSRKIGDIL